METLYLPQYTKGEIAPSLSTATNSIKQTLDEIFPEQKYEDKNIQTAKELMGELANEFSREQIRDIISEIHYLTDSWLDDFERIVFGGLTLKEVLHEKGGL